jgi:hypothetical protein
MLTSSMPTASASGATVERDDIGATMAKDRPMMLADSGKTHQAGHLAAATADSA